MELDVFASGLKGLQDALTRDWFGPLVLIVGAAFIIYFFAKKKWGPLISFAALWAIVAVIVFFSDSLFGENGIFTNLVKSGTQTIGTIITMFT